MHKSRPDLYAEITAELIAQIEADPGQPEMPWRRADASPLWMARNAETGDHYRGINVLMLWIAAETRRFSAPVWATYRQWQALGAQVRAGEKGSRIVKYGEWHATPDTDDPDDDGKRLYLKGYTVFNAAQVDGYQAPEAPDPLPPVERIARAEAFLANLGATVKIGGDRAFYRPSTDTIHMPDEALFTGTSTMGRTEAWYALAAHEHGHWTSHPDRCRRELGRRFGDRQYAAEELVAEIVSAQVCAVLEITPDVRPDHAQYLAQWLTLMKADAKAIFTAAAAASTAVDYMLALQPPGLFPEHDARLARLAGERSQGEQAAATDATLVAGVGDQANGEARVTPERRDAGIARRLRAPEAQR